MARKAVINAVQTAAVESMRHRLDMGIDQFSEALGLGASTYGEMKREQRISKTVALAAETLVRRQAPGSEAEVTFLTRMVRGVPITTVLDGDTRTLILDGQKYLLIPAVSLWRGERRTERQAGNGAERPAATLPGPIGDERAIEQNIVG